MDNFSSSSFSKSALSVLSACPFARTFCSSSKMNPGQQNSAVSSFWDWFLRAKNTLLWDGKVENPVLVNFAVNLQLQAYRNAKILTQHQPLPLQSRWSSPSTGGGIDVVFQDEAGSYAGGFVRKINHVNNPYTVDLMAAGEGLYWAMQWSMQFIILESDALQVVQGVGSLKQGSSSSDLLLDDVRECLRGFGSSKICHVSHSTNGAAHRMAKLALYFSSTFHWFEEPPELIQGILLDDCMLIS
ncbi:unnamed protein product [Malus baccata var. baccata]